MRLEIPETSAFEDWSVEEMPQGFTMPGGLSERYLTGGWRSMRPVWDEGRCTSCLACWIGCPDLSILVSDGRMTGIDYDHCKGCGICINECRFDALALVREDEAAADDGLAAPAGAGAGAASKGGE